MGFLDEIGLAGVFKEIKTRLGKKVNSTDMDTELAKKVDKTSIGANNGVAQLDANGTVPASQLPSYVDDVIEGYLNGGKFYKTQTVGTDKSVKYSDEIQGENGKIYIDKATSDNKIYRYTTAGYVPISDVSEATLRDIAQLKIDVEKLVNITWSELKALRDAGNLIPGLQYRITNYLCTTIQENTTAASHQFDIIVTADSKSKLNERARAIRHDGDENLADATFKTVNGVTTKTAYFANSKLEAWKIWYCLDNDTNRFGWADTTYGRGVIYRMIDEFNNDCPYDFKNIQFKRYKITGGGAKSLKNKYLACESGNPDGVTIDNQDSVWCYTFNGARIKGQDEAANYDETVYEAKNLDLTVAMAGKKYYNENYYSICHSNVIKQKISNDDSNSPVIILNNIVLNGRFADKQSWMEFGNNILDTAICPSRNLFGIDCDFNSFGNGCSNNIFGNGCSNNIFGDNCSSNSFGDDCSSNSFGDYCSSNSFGDNCSSNSFGDYCSNNSFGDNCGTNTCEDYFTGNSFGFQCYGNTFGVNCETNNFGTNVYSNNFGPECYSNSFGSDCSSNVLGEYCRGNIFGHNCLHNIFGNNCHSNSFGNNTSKNKFNNYYRYNKLDNGVRYIIFNGVGNESKYVQNYHIKQGMTFTSTTQYTITAKIGLAYETTVAKQSDDTVAEYNEADLLKTIQTSDIINIANSNLD